MRKDEKTPAKTVCVQCAPKLCRPHHTPLRLLAAAVCACASCSVTASVYVFRRHRYRSRSRCHGHRCACDLPIGRVSMRDGQGYPRVLGGCHYPVLRAPCVCVCACVCGCLEPHTHAARRCSTALTRMSVYLLATNPQTVLVVAATALLRFRVGVRLDNNRVAGANVRHATITATALASHLGAVADEAVDFCSISSRHATSAGEAQQPQMREMAQRKQRTCQNAVECRLDASRV